MNNVYSFNRKTNVMEMKVPRMDGQYILSTFKCQIGYLKKDVLYLVTTLMKIFKN